MRRALAALPLILALSALPAPGRCGKIGGTLGKYTLGGAGVGALLGAAAATIPWLTSRQTWDFITGAGAGTLVGAGAGFIGGVVDLATHTAGDEEPASEARLPAGPWLAFDAPRGGARLGYRILF